MTAVKTVYTPEAAARMRELRDYFRANKEIALTTHERDMLAMLDKAVTYFIQDCKNEKAVECALLYCGIFTSRTMKGVK